MTYWITSLSLIAFGFVAILSVGRPFLLVGVALLALYPLRKRPALFWPPLAAVVAWNVAFMSAAPSICSATETIASSAPGAGSGESTTVCSNLIGMTWRGGGIYNPSLEPANQAAFVVAVITFVIVLTAMLWTQRAAPGGPTPRGSR